MDAEEIAAATWLNLLITAFRLPVPENDVRAAMRILNSSASLQSRLEAIVDSVTAPSPSVMARMRKANEKLAGDILHEVVYGSIIFEDKFRRNILKLLTKDPAKHLPEIVCLWGPLVCGVVRLTETKMTGFFLSRLHGVFSRKLPL